MGPFSIEEVLAAEAEQLHGDKWRAARARLAPADKPGENANEDKQAKQAKRFKIDADRRDGEEIARTDVDRRTALYRALNEQNSAALCLSGGGIRSATFCLGVIQALAGYNASNPAPPKSSGPPSSSESGVAKPSVPTGHKHGIAPEDSLLGRFHYLSTVSGGGYIGSWLSAWRQRDDFPTIIRNLTSRPSGPDVEPPEISWLRAYSNYLTPKTGIGSADTWTGVAIYLRNLLLNWLIIITAVCIALLGLKIIATGSVWVARDGAWWLLDLVGLLGVACLVVALAFTTAHRPTRREKPDTMASARDGNMNIKQVVFIKYDLLWALASAVLITSFFASRCGTEWVVNTGKDWVLILTAIAGILIYMLGWMFGWPWHRGYKDFIRWSGSGAVYGAAIGFGAYLFTLLLPYTGGLSERHHLLNLLIPMIFGVPWVLFAQLMAEMIFVGLTSAEKNSDADREWLGRAAGWLAAGAIIWAIVATLTLAGGYLVWEFANWGAPIVAASGGISGVIVALLGKSAKTLAKPKGADEGAKSKAMDIVLKVAGPIFAAALVIALSIGLDQLLIDRSLVEALRRMAPSAGYISLWLFIGLVVAIAIEWLASVNVNINRFSLHAVYRNRLIRAYLGATRQKRDPDNFTGFDINDNVQIHKIWPTKPDPVGKCAHGLFHVVNIALNVVSGNRLAWQERKAESFTVSALHSGSAYKGFRPSVEYGDHPGRGGISLGTAMAISGAATSPNMGYHSSPSITLLLALFNVRLGWWLGNPGPEGESSYQSDGPNYAIKPLFQETFGLTTDESSYVYLTDGGHFENLGLYEMVRRRCRFIVAVDAGCDPDFAFEDLGNAVRKIYIDLGIRVHFEGLDVIHNRPKLETNVCKSPTEELRKKVPYYAIGVIDYDAADGDDKHHCEPGYILYIKPAYHGTEGAGIRSYATAHPKFPHESTDDQWFTESQFESYRSLGLDITKAILDDSDILIAPNLSLRKLIGDLPKTIR